MKVNQLASQEPILRGVDLSDANVSVQIDLGRRSIASTSCSKVIEEIGGESVVEASSLVWKEEESRASTKSVLIGKVLTENNFVNSTVLSTMQKAGNMEEGLRVIDVWKNVFIFVIDSKEECRRILRGHPWSIQGHLICLQERGQYDVIDEIDFNSSPFWIQLHDVPLEAMSVDNLHRFSTHFGRLVMIEDPDCIILFSILITSGEEKSFYRNLLHIS
ncbi:hypothetical protein K1719_000745 [Acacia pycnantha]|nr:hypothetical protein K1719_000745 [Acacia pycnantha]